MTRQILLLFGLLIGISCIGQNNKINLNIPDKVKTSKTTKHSRFPGTRIFIESPKNYKAISSLMRIQKDNNTYIQAFELSGTSFLYRKDFVRKTFQEAKLKGLDVFYEKEFSLGNSNAYLVYAMDTKPNMEQIGLIFGDSSAICMVVGEFVANDIQSREEIIKSMLTCILDKQFKLNPLELAKFEIDVSKSKFKFTKAISNLYYYTIDGDADLENDASVPFIQVMSLPAMTNDKIKDYSLEMLSRYKNNGIEFSSFEQRELKINSNYAYEIKYKCKIKGIDAYTYQIVTSDKNGAVLFIGNSILSQSDFTKEYSKIALTIKIK